MENRITELPNTTREVWLTVNSKRKIVAGVILIKVPAYKSMYSQMIGRVRRGHRTPT